MAGIAFVFVCPPARPFSGGASGRLRPSRPLSKARPRDRGDFGSQRTRVAVTAVITTTTVTAVFRRERTLARGAPVTTVRAVSTVK